MKNNVFIIGNGFDLDLGWKTKFSDFAKSDYWPKADEYSRLQQTLDAPKDINSWFDLENELLVYAMANVVKIGRPSPVADISYFKQIHEGLTEYLKQQQELPILKDSIAALVLEAICYNGYFDSIYSFNYTDLNKIAKNLNINQQISYKHIHGSVADNSIIIGVDESDLMNGYEVFHKIVSPHYRSHTIIDDLQSAEEIVFFGISFGRIDYIYFESLFQDLANKEKYNTTKRKHVTIFTKDDISRIKILTNLKRMGIDRLRLYSQCNFDIIKTSVPDDKERLDKFLQRLEEKRARQRMVDDLSTMLG